jgi:hypothetical protein
MPFGLTFDVQIDEVYAFIGFAGTWFSIAGPKKKLDLHIQTQHS